MIATLSGCLVAFFHVETDLSVRKGHFDVGVG
ncbi:hypothetical protein J2T21_000351 [Paeniglutamicibacter psychrophenolicus]|nr:hypothetical protein [Paeniglutamicibacter psychrophenolicus]